MLADSVEASSRTLADPTPARIKNHIDAIIKGIFSEGQLDESELTFKDLHFLSENFQRILTGIFHQRIAYPEAKIKDATQSDRSRQEGKGAQGKTQPGAKPGAARTASGTGQGAQSAPPAAKNPSTHVRPPKRRSGSGNYALRPARACPKGRTRRCREPRRGAGVQCRGSSRVNVTGKSAQAGPEGGAVRVFTHYAAVAWLLPLSRAEIILALAEHGCASSGTATPARQAAWSCILWTMQS